VSASSGREPTLFVRTNPGVLDFFVFAPRQPDDLRAVAQIVLISKHILRFALESVRRARVMAVVVTILPWRYTKNPFFRPVPRACAARHLSSASPSAVTTANYTSSATDFASRREVRRCGIARPAASPASHLYTARPTECAPRLLDYAAPPSLALARVIAAREGRLLRFYYTRHRDRIALMPFAYDPLVLKAGYSAYWRLVTNPILARVLRPAARHAASVRRARLTRSPSDRTHLPYGFIRVFELFGGVALVLVCAFASDWR